jgi:hypothetical protein
MSSPLKDHLNIMWENDAILCTTTKIDGVSLSDTSQKISATVTKDPIVPAVMSQSSDESQKFSAPFTPNTMVQAVTDAQSWQDLHHIIYPAISKCTRETNSPMVRLWSTAIASGIHDMSTWADVKFALSLETYLDYYNVIVTCPHISKLVKIHFDKVAGVLYFKAHSNIFPVHVTPISNVKSDQPSDALILPNLG